MTKEEIKAAAKNYSEKVYYTTPRSINKDTIDDFTAGAEWGAGEMEKEACEFAEWLNLWAKKNKMKQMVKVDADLTIPIEKFWTNWTRTRKEPCTEYTTSELYQIFKQQKP